MCPLQEKVNKIIEKYVSKSRKAAAGGRDWRALLSSAFERERGCDPLADLAAGHAGGQQPGGIHATEEMAYRWREAAGAPSL